MKYSIWNLPINNKKCFMDLNEGDKFDLGDYVPVWHGEIQPRTKSLSGDSIEDRLECCEALFSMFNIDLPEHFAGHPMGVSDVIMFETDGEDELYFCDKIGFKKINLK